MICEKCIHNSVCKYGELRSNGIYCTGDQCKQFKDESLCIELSHEETTEYGLKNIYTGKIWDSTFDCEYLANKFRSRNLTSDGWYIIQRKVRTYEWEELE